MSRRGECGVDGERRRWSIASPAWAPPTRLGMLFRASVGRFFQRPAGNLVDEFDHGRLRARRRLGVGGRVIGMSAASFRFGFRSGYELELDRLADRDAGHRLASAERRDVEEYVGAPIGTDEAKSLVGEKRDDRSVTHGVF